MPGDGLPSPVLEERQNMDNKEYNERRHNRKKQECRFQLGIQQFCNYPIINLPKETKLNDMLDISFDRKAKVEMIFKAN